MNRSEETRQAWLNMAVLGAISVVYTLLAKLADVANIGPEGTHVGFARLNGMVHDIVGVNLVWYQITVVVGLLSIALATYFALLGLIQWIRRKDIRKVDKGLLSMGIMYVVLGFLYVFFDRVVINYRPVIMSGEAGPVPSFPSSYTMLASTIFAGAIPYWMRRLKKNRAQAVTLTWLCYGLMVTMIVGRIASGVNWFTDVVGGILYGYTLVLFSTCVYRTLKDLSRGKIQYEYDQDLSDAEAVMAAALEAEELQEAEAQLAAQAQQEAEAQQAAQAQQEAETQQATENAGSGV